MGYRYILKWRLDELEHNIVAALKKFLKQNKATDGLKDGH